MPSSPPLRPLSLETSLQSHSNDNIPTSPPRRGSGRTSLSPADCCTLEKILCDVASLPATSSPVEQSDQLLLDSRRPSTAGITDEEDGYRPTSGEDTGTGYEDEDGSMELSEGGEVVTDEIITSLGEPTSLSVSKYDRRLQESVSAHDEKEKLRYSSGRGSATAKRTNTEYPGQERSTSQEVTTGDMIENVMNIPGKRAPPARPLDLGRGDSDRQAVSDDSKQLNHMRLSMEKVLDQERLEQERVEDEEEPGVFISTVPGPQGQAQDHEESGSDGFDADNERTQPRFSLGTTGAPRRKISQGGAPKSLDQSSPIIMRNVVETPILAPSTPTPAPATQTPESAHIQTTTSQSVLETPFTKTLSYFKQYQGAENSPFMRRRNTALPQDLVELTEDVADTLNKTDDMLCNSEQPEVQDACVLTGASALEDLKAMVQSNGTIEAAGAAVQQEYDYIQDSAVEEQTTRKAEVAPESPVSDDQKQIILYPQHPAFINAIGMIPATMFWATAAPVLKYTGIAVELLIDRLRDTYL
ncbi:hypothetical protein N0V86_002060 [Didymella sp. IMI 355093]|nr:hypothetical protein N0V86_002060 [Didymella sp. IMI 355093]